MPLYEYRCDDCLEVTETLRRMADADAPIRCEHCGSESTRRVQSVVAVGAATAGGSASAAAPACDMPGGCCGGGMCGMP